jgi:hypothetical protein
MNIQIITRNNGIYSGMDTVKLQNYYRLAHQMLRRGVTEGRFRLWREVDAMKEELRKR